MRKSGSATLDVMSFQLAVDVAAEIVGLTERDSRGLAQRMRRTLNASLIEIRNPVKRLANGVRIAFNMWNFYRNDLAPAVRARRARHRDDVIGYMVQQNYSTKAMIIECLTYAGAGMVTTREFIVVSAWHLFDNGTLRERFLAGDEREQFAILYEILRLEPVASMLYRRDADARDEVFALDIRAANTDEQVTGSCPFSLDPDRAKRMKVEPSFMSFGDGHHRCPGAKWRFTRPGCSSTHCCGVDVPARTRLDDPAPLPAVLAGEHLHHVALLHLHRRGHRSEHLRGQARQSS